MHALSPSLLISLAVGVLALVLLLVGGAWLVLAWRQARSGLAVDEALARRRAGAPVAEPKGQEPPALGRSLDTLVRLGGNWAAGRFGMLLMAEEDRFLVERAGYRSTTRAKAFFLMARLALALLLPLVVVLGRPVLGTSGMASHPVLLGFLGFGVGWMTPKWLIQRRVGRRMESAGKELPLFIDLLRLLQGVGLSVDQSLHIIVDEFHEVMPVLSQELEWSLDMYARGRTREQSLARLSNHFDNDDLAAICRLLCQVEEQGGAVQEPLARFSGRLRDQRKLDLKAQIGKLTVKMTGVMVLTLLPALLIVTGGAGFVAILRGLSRLSG
ncbi:type II secretion system F family protein [Castellaniella sp.]|uniref:type II secretion system F family protein n=1 Tax=Castellaniella sp. TaxID=1955812 RepID=UPI003C753E76